MSPPAQPKPPPYDKGLDAGWSIRLQQVMSEACVVRKAAEVWSKVDGCTGVTRCGARSYTLDNEFSLSSIGNRAWKLDNDQLLQRAKANSEQAHKGHDVNKKQFYTKEVR